MSADLLREAAALMRERSAGLVVDGERWRAYAIGDDEGGYVLAINGNLTYTVAETDSPDHAFHAASWPPAVALAVADLLDAEADFDETLKAHGARGLADDDPAYIIARAYLGRAA